MPRTIRPACENGAGCVYRSFRGAGRSASAGKRSRGSFLCSKDAEDRFSQSGIGALGPLRGGLNAASTKGWRLFGLTFELDSTLAHRKLPITKVAADGTITTAVPHGLQTWQQVYIVGVQGFKGRGPNGSWAAIVTGASTLKLSAAAYGVMGTPIFTCSQAPCYVAGTGYVLQTIGSAIVSATPTTPPVVTTQMEHGLFNEPWANIVSASGATLTLESGHSIDARKLSVEIAGSSVSAYNGTWVTTGASGNSLPLTGGPASSCSTNCGRVRMKRSIHIRGALGAPGLNGNHLYTVIDDTKVQIDDATGGIYRGSGVLAFDPDYYFNMVRAFPTASRIIFDRASSRAPNGRIACYTASCWDPKTVRSSIRAWKI